MLSACGQWTRKQESKTPAAEEPPMSDGMESGQLEPSEDAAPTPESGEALVPIDESRWTGREALTLEGNDLIVDRLAVRSLPDGVRAYRVSLNPETIEFRSETGRLAVIERQTWSSVAQPGAHPIGPVRVRERAVQLDDWDGERATVIWQHWSDDMYVYTVEHLPDATWVGLQLDLDPTLRATASANNEVSQ